MSLNTLSTSNTFVEWLTLTNQLTLQQSFFESSIVDLNASANISTQIVVTPTTVADSYFLVSANVVTGNATNVFAHSEAYYNPATKVLAVPSTQFTGNSNVILPRGNTAQRPANTISGMIRYNNSTEKFEGYANGWDTIVLTNDINTSNSGTIGYSESGQIITMSEQLLSGKYQNTAYTYDINNERIVTEVITIGSATKTTTYTYNSSNVLTSWITVES